MIAITGLSGRHKTFSDKVTLSVATSSCLSDLDCKKITNSSDSYVDSLGVLRNYHTVNKINTSNEFNSEKRVFKKININPSSCGMGKLLNFFKDNIDPYIECSKRISNLLNFLKEDLCLDYRKFKKPVKSVGFLFVLFQEIIEKSSRNRSLIKPELSFHNDGIIQAQWLLSSNQFFVVACDIGENSQPRYSFAVAMRKDENSNLLFIESTANDVDDLIYMVDSLKIIIKLQK